MNLPFTCPPMRARLLTTTTCVKRWQRGADVECRDCPLAHERGATGDWKEVGMQRVNFVMGGMRQEEHHRRNAGIARMGRKKRTRSMGSEIFTLRKQAGLTQRQLAERIGLGDGANLGKYERNCQGTSDDMIQRIREACGRNA